jgi:hypothetical protein
MPFWKRKDKKEPKTYIIDGHVFNGLASDGSYPLHDAVHIAYIDYMVRDEGA